MRPKILGFRPIRGRLKGLVNGAKGSVVVSTRYIWSMSLHRMVFVGGNFGQFPLYCLSENEIKNWVANSSKHEHGMHGALGLEQLECRLRCNYKAFVLRGGLASKESIIFDICLCCLLRHNCKTGGHNCKTGN